MKKISVELSRVSKGMRLKFNLILDSPESPNQRKDSGLTSVYEIDGNQYIKLNPHPYLTIDISDSFGKKDGWNYNHSVNINWLAKMKLERVLLFSLQNMKIKNLFYYGTDNRLYVNHNVSKPLEERMKFVLGNKYCEMKYAVIKDETNIDIEYEGIIFLINSAENFCYLTVDELSLLYYILTNTNLNTIALQVMSYYESVMKKDDLPESIEISPEIVKEEIEEQPEPVYTPPMENTSDLLPDIE